MDDSGHIADTDNPVSQLDGWQEYVPTQASPPRDEAVAIMSRAASLRLTAKAIDLIAKPTHLILMFDRVGQRVGLRADDGSTRYAFPLRRYGGGHILNVAIGGFRNWAGITLDERREFPVEQVDSQTLCFSLTDSDQHGEFEEFIHKSVAISHLSPNVAISRNGNLTLNLASMELIGSPDKVVLLYNSSLNAIGLRPAKPDERHARPIRRASTQRTWTVSATGFLKAFNVEHDEGRSYEAAQRESMLIINLNSPKAVRRRKTFEQGQQEMEVASDSR